jgi:hypothetical protein
MAQAQSNTNVLVLTHNMAVTIATSAANELHHEEDRHYAGILLSFVERHLRWAEKAR